MLRFGEVYKVYQKLRFLLDAQKLAYVAAPSTLFKNPQSIAYAKVKPAREYCFVGCVAAYHSRVYPHNVCEQASTVRPSFQAGRLSTVTSASNHAQCPSLERFPLDLRCDLHRHAPSPWLEVAGRFRR